MKTLKNLLLESLSPNFKKLVQTLKKCQSLEEALCAIFKLDKLEDLTEDDYYSFDMGYQTFPDEEEIEFDEFIEKVRTYERPLKKVKADDKDDNYECIISFECNGDNFEFFLNEEN
jgi:hypothetical protein